MCSFPVQYVFSNSNTIKILLLQESENPLECKVCFNIFDCDKRRPRNLPCGHSYCTSCIAGMIKNSHLSCPNCRTDHTADDVTLFPINYSLEAVVKKIAGKRLSSLKMEPEGAEATAPEAKAESSQNRSQTMSKQLNSLVEEQRKSIIDLGTSCEEVLSQLEHYHEELGDWKAQHHQYIEKLHEVVDRNKAAVYLLEQEEMRVMDMVKEGKERHKELGTMQDSLSTINTSQEVITGMEEAERINEETERWARMFRELFPDTKTVQKSFRVSTQLQDHF